MHIVQHLHTGPPAGKFVSGCAPACLPVPATGSSEFTPSLLNQLNKLIGRPEEGARSVGSTTINHGSWTIGVAWHQGSRIHMEDTHGISLLDLKCVHGTSCASTDMTGMNRSNADVCSVQNGTGRAALDLPPYHPQPGEAPAQQQPQPLQGQHQPGVQVHPQQQQQQQQQDNMQGVQPDVQPLSAKLPGSLGILTSHKKDISPRSGVAGLSPMVHPTKMRRHELRAHAACPTTSPPPSRPSTPCPMASSTEAEADDEQGKGGELQTQPGSLHSPAGTDTADGAGGYSHKTLCCAVYDGHGGGEVARYAALRLPEAIAAALRGAPTGASPESDTSPRSDTATGTPSPRSDSSPLSTKTQVDGEGLFNTDGRHRPGCRQSQGGAVGPSSEAQAEAIKQAYMSLDKQLSDPANALELYRLTGKPGSAEASCIAEGYGWWGDAQDGAYIGPSAGATAVTALLTEDGAGSGGVLTVAFVGDSRALLCLNAYKEPQQLTRDHKPFEDEAEEARVVAAGGWVSRSGRVNSELDMSRCLGDMAHDLPSEQQAVIALPDVVPINLPYSHHNKPFLYLLLCTDGLTNAMTNAQVHALIRDDLQAGEEPDCICRKLCELACSNPWADNTTAMLIVP